MLFKCLVFINDSTFYFDRHNYKLENTRRGPRSLCVAIRIKTLLLHQITS